MTLAKYRPSPLGSSLKGCMRDLCKARRAAVKVLLTEVHLVYHFTMVKYPCLVCPTFWSGSSSRWSLLDGPLDSGSLPPFMSIFTPHPTVTSLTVSERLDSTNRLIRTIFILGTTPQVSVKNIPFALHTVIMCVCLIKCSLPWTFVKYRCSHAFYWEILQVFVSMCFCIEQCLK